MNAKSRCEGPTNNEPSTNARTTTTNGWEVAERINQSSSTRYGAGVNCKIGKGSKAGGGSKTRQQGTATTTNAARQRCMASARGWQAKGGGVNGLAAAISERTGARRRQARAWGGKARRGKGGRQVRYNSITRARQARRGQGKSARTTAGKCWA